jgi:hypothetical protein
MIVALLVYSGLWYTAAFQAEKDVTATFAGWRDRGIQVEHGKIEHGGFPYRITVTIQDLSFHTRSKGVAFSADTILLVSHLWTPNHWIAEARNVTAGFARGSTRFSDAFLHGSYKLHSNGKTLIVVNSRGTDDFKLSKLLGFSPPTLTDWELAFWLKNTDQQSAGGLYGARFLDFKVTGRTQENLLEIRGGISGPVITDWNKKALANWRDEGGLVELDTLEYHNREGQTKGSASLTLDNGFRPLGSVSLAQAARCELLGFTIDENTTSAMLQNGVLSVDGRKVLDLDPVIR